MLLNARRWPDLHATLRVRPRGDGWPIGGGVVQKCLRVKIRHVSAEQTNIGNPPPPELIKFLVAARPTSLDGSAHSRNWKFRASLQTPGSYERAALALCIQGMMVAWVDGLARLSHLFFSIFFQSLGKFRPGLGHFQQHQLVFGITHNQSQVQAFGRHLLILLGCVQCPSHDIRRGNFVPVS